MEENMDTYKPMVFKSSAPLKSYLTHEYPKIDFDEKVVTCIGEIYHLVINLVDTKRLYDVTNTLIILPDSDMERALKCKGLHRQELNRFIEPQLHAAGNEALEIVDDTLWGRNIEEINQIRCSLLAVATMGYTRHGRGNWALPNYPLEVGTSRHILPFQFIAPQQVCRVKTPFRRVLNMIPGVSVYKMEFRYGELTKLLSSYLLHPSRKDRLIDPRNPRIVFLDDDPLGQAFGIRSMHRSQVIGLLQSQLIWNVPSTTTSREHSYSRKRRWNATQ